MFYRQWNIRNVAVLDVRSAAHLEAFWMKQGVLFVHVSNILGVCRGVRVPSHASYAETCSLSLDFERPCDQRVMWLYGWQSLMVSHHPANFDCHRHCGSVDVFIDWRERFQRFSFHNPRLLFISKGHCLKMHSIWY